MEIRENINVEEWSKFVKEHPHGNIFQTPEMFEIYQRTKNFEPILIVAVKEDEVVGLLLGNIQKELSGIAGKFSKRSIVRGGPLIKNNDKHVLDVILKAYNKKVKTKAIYTQFRNQWDWGSLKNIFLENRYKYEGHLDILINLEQTEEDLWKNIKSNARNKIRKANKSGITFEVIDHSDDIIDISYKVLEDIYKHAKLPLVDKSMFQNTYDVLKEKNRIKFFCALKDDKIIGVRIGLLYEDLIYDWYAGSIFEYYKFNPNDFLPFNILIWGHRKGYKLFDFGGAGKPNVPYGVRDHKMKFGGNLVEFGRFELIHKPITMQIAKKGLRLYKRFV